MGQSFSEIITSVKSINDGLRELINHEIVEHQPVIELIKERQTLLEYLVAEVTLEPNDSKIQALADVNTDIAALDTLYKNKFENIKQDIKKLQTAQKGVKAYGTVKHSR